MARALLALIVLLAGLAADPASADPILKRLKGGVNIETDQIDQLSNADLDYMSKVGIRAIRIFMWPKHGQAWNYVKPGEPMDPSHNDYVRKIGHFITRAVARDIAVIVVPFGGSSYRPVSDPKEIAMQVGWMEEFAAYAEFHWDPDWVFIQIWNEPTMKTPEEWRAVETQLLAAVRRTAPAFTVVATSTKWSSKDAIIQLMPYNDKKVIYDLHYYHPMDYTHQGVPWLDASLKKLCNVPYPTPRGFGPAKIEAELGEVAAWAKKHKVRVVMGEFGVANRCTNPADKAAYLRDVRKTAEDLNLGWLVWEYTKAFAIAEKDEEGALAIKPEYIDALGWKHVER